MSLVKCFTSYFLTLCCVGEGDRGSVTSCGVIAMARHTFFCWGRDQFYLHSIFSLVLRLSMFVAEYSEHTKTCKEENFPSHRR